MLLRTLKFSPSSSLVVSRKHALSLALSRTSLPDRGSLLFSCCLLRRVPCFFFFFDCAFHPSVATTLSNPFSPSKVSLATADISASPPVIRVIGVGGAGENEKKSAASQVDFFFCVLIAITGGNAVNNMVQNQLSGVEFLAMNTDAQALARSLCDEKNRIQLGPTCCAGLGAGSSNDRGREAALEVLEEIKQRLKGANMVFITAGMGGGTGTGAAPVIAEVCKELGILAVGVVTKPFNFEGNYRMKMANFGVRELEQVSAKCSLFHLLCLGVFFFFKKKSDASYQYSILQLGCGHAACHSESKSLHRGASQDTDDGSVFNGGSCALSWCM